MDIRDYCLEVTRTSSADYSIDEAFKLAAIAIPGELGEIAYHLNNFLWYELCDLNRGGARYYPDEIERGELIKEAGDLLWYTVYLLQAVCKVTDAPTTHAVLVRALSDHGSFVSFQQFVETQPMTELALIMTRLTMHAGLLAELVKKNQYHAKPLNTEEVIGEAQAIIYYLTMLLSRYNITLDTVAETNVTKLRKRLPNGWDVAAAAARVDVNG